MKAVLVGSVVDGFDIKMVGSDASALEAYAASQTKEGKTTEVVSLRDPKERDSDWSRADDGEFVVAMNFGLGNGCKFYGPFEDPDDANEFAEANRSSNAEWEVLTIRADAPVELSTDSQNEGDPFTVISVNEATGQIFMDKVVASDAIHAFAVTAANERADTANSFVCAIPGHVKEGAGIEFPGEGMVDVNTVLEQTDVFGDGSARERVTG